MKRLGVDVGGTFTDLIFVDDGGHVSVHKVPSTPKDPSQGSVTGALELCRSAGVQPADVDQFFHGTTVATNIILEHNGAEVGLITTRGFPDILHIARHKKPFNWSNFQDLPWQRFPLVKRRHRLPVGERITVGGTVLEPLNEEEVRAAVKQLKTAGVEAVAVCFLFSFANPEHELRAKEIVLEEFPEAFLSIRHEVLPQYREYEGFSTVCLNAYVGPKVSRYVRRLGETMRAASACTRFPRHRTIRRRERSWERWSCARQQVSGHATWTSSSTARRSRPTSSSNTTAPRSD